MNITQLFSQVKSYVLPIALVLGSIFHSWCAQWSFLSPYGIFLILLLNFTAVDLRRLRIHRIDWVLMAFQTFVSLGLYLAIRTLFHSEVIAQGALIGIMCPVAASVVVIACMLGANREIVTTYTILGNLLVSVLGPLYFSFIGTNQEMPFWDSFLLILGHIAPILALPFFLALLLELLAPRIRSALSSVKGYTFPIWALILMISLGQTINTILDRMETDGMVIIVLGVMAVSFCAMQFAIGRRIGERFGDKAGGGQLLGQKNSAMGIWLAGIYLDPLTTSYFAFYAISQNLFNSYQLYMLDHGFKKLDA